MVRRSRFEIDMAVLEALSETEKPTRLMYRANLSWDSVQDCLSRLIKRGLATVQKKGKSKIYKRTKAGDKALSYYYTLTGIMEVDDSK